MNAVCRNCKALYSTRMKVKVEGYCCDYCIERKCRRLGWKLRMAVTYEKFIRRFPRHLGHKVPSPPKTIQMWGIIPPLQKGKFQFHGQLAYVKGDSEARHWIDNWISEVFKEWYSEELNCQVVVVSRDDYRKTESMAHAKENENVNCKKPKYVRKRSNAVPTRNTKRKQSR